MSTDADRAWLDEWKGGEVGRIQGREGSEGPDGAPYSSSDGETWVLQEEGRLVGWMQLARSERLSPSPLHPWSPLEGDAICRTHPEGRFLHAIRLGWLEGSTGPCRRRTLLREGGRRRCDRMGAEALLHVVAPGAFEARRRSTSPAGYLQQLHHRALSDPVLTPCLEAGFQLDGYRPSPVGDDAPFEVLLVWRP